MFGISLSAFFWNELNDHIGDNITSTIHALLVSCISLYSLTYLEEYVIINWVFGVISGGYFLADLNGNLKKDMLIHHIAGLLALCWINLYYNNSTILAKGILMEGSTPFLNEFKRTKLNRWGFGLLFTFTLLRLIWFPWTFYNFITHEEPELSNLIRVLVCCFIGMNYWWHFKICKIAFNVYKKS